MAKKFIINLPENYIEEDFVLECKRAIPHSTDTLPYFKKGGRVLYDIVLKLPHGVVEEFYRLMEKRKADARSPKPNKSAKYK